MHLTLFSGLIYDAKLQCQVEKEAGKKYITPLRDRTGKDPPDFSEEQHNT